MRAALIAALVSAAAAAHAGTPLALAERQVVTLEFDRAVARVAVTDPDLLALHAQGSRLRVGALRAGRAALEIAFEDGATVVYDVTVEAARRPAAASQGAPGEIALQIGEERRLRAPGVARVLLEENGVARVRANGESVTVIGVSPGTTSLVLVDGAGARTTWAIRVR
ncbi:MAG TPA: pilus assembly protein N-terminal domain-containing protein [Anaeromyxobacter sp.]